MFKYGIVALIVLFSLFSKGQSQVIDKVIAVVAKYPVLLSDLQNVMLEREGQGLPITKCKAYELLIFQKLLVAQADRDSITVTDTEVDTELSRRMAYFVSQFGSEQKLEEFYGKRTNVIKDELRSEVEEQLLAEKMNGKITGEIKLTPAEVRHFYGTIPTDSLPLIDSEVELQQLVKKPTYSEQAKKEAKETLETYRQRVIKGEVSMSTLARLYSEDPGSAKEGGFYANIGRGQFDPVFESVAFRLKNGEISHIFESAYGYHFVELVQRRGELIDLRHILIIPKITNDDFLRSKKQLDSIYTEIREGRLSFEAAVKRFSDDADTKLNGGLMINPQTASTRFDNEILSQIDKNLIATLNSMEIGEISNPMQFAAPDGKPGFRILKLKNRIDPHKANLKEDYQRIMGLATNEKKKGITKDWIKKKSKITYIRLEPEFNCTFDNEWTISN